MQKTTAGKILIILMYIVISAVPLVFFNRAKNVIAPGENRYLEDFPVLFDDAGKLNDDIKPAIENWFEDHLGKRNEFVRLQAMTKVHLLHQSSNERVHIGKDGWYYYTVNDNLKIADGTYPLTDELLAKFAQTQQAISDWYKERGVEYVFVLTPSKASVYPEYVGGGDYEIGVSPADIVEEYFKQHTDIHVVNLKAANVQAKESGLQFKKTDTHWTELGSYTAYRALAGYLETQGILSSKPVETAVSEGEHPGELSVMLGGNILPPEVVPTIQWTAHSSVITEGDQYARLEEIRRQEDSQFSMIFLQNEMAEDDKTLLIYGDSQWLINMPQLLAEHFREVVSYAMNTIPSMAMDEAVQPDVVIVGCSERYINMIGSREFPFAQ